MEYSQRLEKELQDAVNLAQSHLAEAERAQDELTRVQGSYEALKQKLQGDRNSRLFEAARDAMKGLLSNPAITQIDEDGDLTVDENLIASTAVVQAVALLRAVESAAAVQQ